MSPLRRAWLARALLGGLLARWPAARAVGASEVSQAAPDEPGVRRGRTLVFPRDHGAHPAARIEWWYATGWLGDAAAPTHGFQVTFFRSRTGLAEHSRSRFAPRQLLFAHAALTDLGAGTHRHAERIGRWSGDPAQGPDRTALADGDIALGRWRLARAGDTWQAQVDDDALAFELDLRATQPTLLQGDAGFSRKGPEERQASHYYSEVQLAARARVSRGARATDAAGRGWLDHEWSDELLHPQAVGWDWIGINLFDGAALTAFRLRRPDGSAVWAGGSHRAAGGAARAFAPDQVRFAAGRRWTSPTTAATYPLQWQLETPAGRFEVRALLDAQELDSRAGVGTVYWEGLAELRDAAGRRVGLGYLEMTGYASRLRLG